MSETIWARARDILAVLGRWGKQEAVGRLGELGVLPSVEASDEEEAARARSFRESLEQLGPVFLKLGQILSTRPDLVPPIYIRELERLQDRVPPIDAVEAREAVAAYFAGFARSPLADFEGEPVAAASLAQVHRARLRDGTQVAVKLRRPGVVRRVKQDLRILGMAAKLVQRYLVRSDVHDLPGMVEEVGQALTDELDFRSEAQNLGLFARNLARYKSVVVPRAYQALTTEDVLVMEYVDGRPLREGTGLDLPRKTRAALAREVAHAYFQMFFLDGLFHADPHPGNIFLTRDRRIAILDFGMIGRIERQVGDNLVRVLLNFILKDSHGVAHSFLDIGKPTQSADEIGWIMDVRRLLPRYHGIPLEKVNVGTLFIDLFRAAARNRIQAPPIVAMICKSLANMDGSARLLHPEIDLIKAFRAFLPRILEDQVRRTASVENTAKLALDTVIGGQRVPFQIATILEKAATGRLRVVVDPLGMGDVARQLGKVGNRVALGQVASAWLMSRAIRGHGQPPPAPPTVSERFGEPRLDALRGLADRLDEIERRADAALDGARRRKDDDGR